VRRRTPLRPVRGPPVAELKGGVVSSRHVAAAFALALGAALLPALRAAGQSPGLDAPVPVGPYFNGVFPTRTPRDPATAQWEVVPAFPNLALSQPLVIATSPADQRLYVGSRDGRIVAFQNQPNVSTATPYLDLRDRVAVVWDGGFLGMAFHPEFGTPGSPHRGHLYVYYSSYCPIDATRRFVNLAACNPAYPRGETNGFFGTWLRLSRFTVPVGQSVPDPASERVMLNIRLYNGSHRGGGMVFADDGTFWLTIGDQFRYWTAQDLVQTLEGGVLRLQLDVNEGGGGSFTCPAGSHLPIRAFGRPDPVNPTQILGQPDETSGQLYCIPNDNPWLFPNGAAFEEYATIGHRNPHRLAKDPATGRLWSGEIGESTREEVNVLEAGRNYGWPFREGTVAGPSPPPAQILGLLTEPVIDFPRSEAQALIGGYVYHGARLPELQGRYLAGDYVTSRIWAITLDQASMRATATQLASFHPGSLGTFGQDQSGEIFLASVAGSGPLYTLSRVTSGVPDPPARLSQVGAFASLATLSPASAFVPYGLNEPFWSDGAQKRRWIALPNDGVRNTPAEQIGYAPAADWIFPKGTVLMKHFDLPVDEADPSRTTRLETRFMVRGDDARWYGVTYRWRTDQSDADLLTTGAAQSYAIGLAGGGTRTQIWQFPSRSQCLSCHNAGTSGALGVRTHQLNGSFTYPSTGRTDNQLATWRHLGMLAPPPGPPATLARAAAHDDPTASLQARARSWLDANCSSCHRPGTGNRAFFDSRLTTPLASQGLVYGGVIDDLGIPSAYLVAPGSAARSIVWHRAAAAGTSFAMPPLAKSLVDEPGAEVLSAWIQRVDPNFQRSGVEFEYYEVAGLTALPDFDALAPQATGTAATFDLSFRQRDDDFAFRFRGVLRVDLGGTYTFYTSSDDGSRLLLDGALVVDNDGLHSTTERSGSVALAAGYHAIEVTYFELSGQEALAVNWSGPGVAKQPIPASRLSPTVPVPLVNAPPTLANPGFQLGGQHQPVSLALVASDPDGDDLWFEARGLPPGVTLDRESGALGGAPTAPGLYAVTAGVSDGPAVDSESFSWQVLPRICADGVDNDGDGAADYPADRGCANTASPTESPQCQDGVDNDAAPGIDFDGGQSIHGPCTGGVCPPGVSDPERDGIANRDPECIVAYRDDEGPSSCGLGFELALAVPLLAALARRRRAYS
jgi:uncharacterized repeat protein (TIGR03806 family)